MKRQLLLTFTLLFIFGTISNIYGQTKGQKEKIVKQTKANYLLDYAKKKSAKYKTNKAYAIKIAKEKGWIIKNKAKDGTFMELQGLTPKGKPLYYVTHNEDAAVSTSTNKVYSGGSLGLSLDGSGMVAGEWDGGDVLTTHQEFNNTGSSRVTDRDGTSSTHYHATHVAGTIVAGGVQSSAKGMAYNANLDAYDWNDDESEMAAAAAGGLLISNHSYGFGTGWTWTGSSWVWYGDDSISSQEDFQFGFYSSYCADLDNVAKNAPYYLIVKAAGNDKGDGSGQSSHPQDGGSDGYDCIGYSANAKNILTVGAVSDVSGGYSSPSGVTLASFSSTGPCDDSRIKPDIVGNGVGVYSTFNTSNTSYNNLDGTSMASPNVTGSLLLLQEHYYDTQSQYMKAATLKALAIHTADECGSYTGPDYKFGWGLLNTATAANLITNKDTYSLINEETYSGSTYTLEVTASGTEPLMVTIVWADPAGTPVADALDPTDIMLVNDLDMTITGSGGPYYPYKLSAASPSSAATTGDNNVDNVEKIYIASPSAGTYTITINHDGSISGGSQNFSIIVSGIAADVVCNATVPTGLAASSVGSTTATLSWNTVTGTDYDYRYRVVGTSSWETTNTANTSVGLTSLTAETDYQAQVRSNCPSASSSYSSSVYFSTGSIPSCTGITSFPYSEGFETSTGVWIQSTSDDLNWTRDANGTPSNSTGPSSATEGSYYLYIESSTNGTGYPNKTAIFTSPCIDLTGEMNSKLDFAYHMYGSSMGTLTVEASLDGSNWTSLWSESGNQGNSWLTKSINLSAYDGSVIYLRFVGVTSTSYRSDMAIDDLSITTGVDPDYVDVTLTLVVDDYPEETSWAITDDGSSTVASGGTYDSTPDGSTVIETASLEAGCYTLTFYDAYGDGICCSYGSGSYELTEDGSGTSLASGGSFGSTATHNFCVGSSPTSMTNGIITESVFQGIRMHPNPVQDILSVTLAKGKITNMRIITANGSFVETVKNSDNTIDVSHLPSGVYFISVETDGKRKHIERFVKF